MQIDWLTVIAQIVNFLILVWLLKRFLYRPVIDIMDRREQRIAEQLRNAELREKTSVDTTHEYQSKLEALELDRNELMKKAREAAEAERLELLEQARGEVAVKRNLWQRQVTEEQQEFLRSLKHMAADSIQAIARRTLADLADTELEERIIESFIQQLSGLDKESRLAITASSQPVQVTTSYELDSAIRSRLTRAIHKQFKEGLKVVYSESPDPMCGIELSVTGRTLSWSLAGYLQDLEQLVQKQLETVGATSE